MSVLASLAKAYERLSDAPPFGYSAEKIGFVISLNADGSVANVPDLRSADGRKRQPRVMLVPQAVKRTVGISPNFLWDKTAYVLGITLGEGKRTAQEHAAFVKLHVEAIGDSADEGLQVLRRFLENWSPAQFVAPLWPDDAKDQNVVFVLESERLHDSYLHDRPAARALWAHMAAGKERQKSICLVSGDNAPVARLHPSIKGVWGAQTAGAALVSFNLDASTSYGHDQGDNAPVSEAAVFAYTTALNRFLAKDSGHRIQIGDASTVYWAHAPDNGAAADAESLFAGMFDPAAEDAAAVKKIGAQLERMRRGEPLKTIAPELSDGVRFCILGLAPNAARLSIRYWFEDDFGVLAKNYQRFVADMNIEPPPRDIWPPLWRFLCELAVMGKRENVPPNLAGEWMRSILSGGNYPMTLLSAVLMRIRADGDVNALRASILKALLVRNFKYEKEAPVAMDTENTNRGYLLGRLFAVYEQAQSAALGRNVNATIKDKFYASASAQPRKVFSLLERGSVNHLSKVGKQWPGQKINLERSIGSIMEMMSPTDDPFPASLSSAEQALFGLGYYHQRNEYFKKYDKSPDNQENGE